MLPFPPFFSSSFVIVNKLQKEEVVVAVLAVVAVVAEAEKRKNASKCYCNRGWQ